MSTPPLSFTQAQYEGDPAPPDLCAFCHRTLAGEYFRVGNHLACSTCATNAQALVPPDSHQAFTRAVLFGVVAAVVGCLGYALFEIVTNIMIGYIAVGVGWLVGWAMKKGSNGLGGRRYQITAAILTYMAVSVAFVPVAIHENNTQKQNRAAYQSSAQSGSGDSKDANVDSTNPAGKSASPAGTQPDQSGNHAKPGAGSFIVGLGILLGIGLISPFLLLTSSLVSGLLNLVIIFVGIRFAWQFTAGQRVDVQGPFSGRA